MRVQKLGALVYGYRFVDSEVGPLHARYLLTCFLDTTLLAAAASGVCAQ